MLAHNLKEVLQLVPEVLPLVKKASLEKDFPTDSSDSVVASYMTAHYLTKVAGKYVPLETICKLEKAASLYGVKDALDSLLPKLTPMVKQATAEETLSMVKFAEVDFESNLGMYLNVQDMANKASELMSKFSSMITSKEVKRYSGNAYLNKEAAVVALGNRYHASKGKSVEFVKIAQIVANTNEDDFNSIKQICAAVTTLDKQAGYDLIGMNFYKEALITKEAALKDLEVKLAGRSIPYTKVSTFGKDRVGAYIGEDVAKSLTGDPFTDKAILESLPMDLQSILAKVIK